MKKKIRIKSYTFPFVLAQDGSRRGRIVYRAYIPELESRGVATWGYSQEEAIRNLQEVAQMVIEDLLDEGRLPAVRGSRVSMEPLLTVVA